MRRHKGIFRFNGQAMKYEFCYLGSIILMMVMKRMMFIGLK